MGIKKANRKGLHLDKKIVSDFLEHLLADHRNQAVVKQGSQCADQKDSRHHGYYAQQFTEQIFPCIQHFQDIVINDHLHKGVADHRGNDTDQDTCHDNRKFFFVPRGDIVHQSGHCSFSGFIHSRFPLAAEKHRLPDRFYWF